MSPLDFNNPPPIAPPSHLRRSKFNVRSSLYICLLLSAFQLFSISAFCTTPSWWTTYGILDPQAPADDYAAVNQGQAKHVASKTRDYFNATLPGGAGQAINTLVDSWTPPASGTDDFQAINLGQLKNLSKPFYDRLIAVQYANTYPWTTDTNDDEDFALANLGQLKSLFAFDLSFSSDPTNPLPDWWQLLFFTRTGIDPDADPDGDGFSNYEEWLAGSNPNGFFSRPGVEVEPEDSDGDGYADENDAFPYDPLRWLPLVFDPTDQISPAVTLLEPASAALQ